MSERVVSKDDNTLRLWSKCTYIQCVYTVVYLEQSTVCLSGRAVGTDDVVAVAPCSCRRVPERRRLRVFPIVALLCATGHHIKDGL